MAAAGVRAAAARLLLPSHLPHRCRFVHEWAALRQRLDQARAMSTPSDHLPPSQPSRFKRISIEERRSRDAERLKASLLREALDQALGARTRDPSEIGALIGLPAMAAEKLLTRRQWRKGDLALLETAAARLGLDPERP
jgi:hypothetical protein